MAWRLEFYESEGGAEVVLNEIRVLSPTLLAAVGGAIRAAQDVQFRLGAPHVKWISNHTPLKELCITAERREFRLLYVHRAFGALAVDFVAKKGRTLPAKVFRDALSRGSDWDERHKK